MHNHACIRNLFVNVFTTKHALTQYFVVDTFDLYYIVLVSTVVYLHLMRLVLKFVVCQLVACRDSIKCALYIPCNEVYCFRFVLLTACRRLMSDFATTVAATFHLCKG